MHQEAHEYRERLLHTVNKVAEVLLTANENSTLEALMAGMEIVGKCVAVDRVQIWRNEEIDGELHFVMRYEWLSKVGETKREVPLGLRFPYSGIPEWLEMFKQGEYINSPISKLPSRDAAFLGYYEMVSIVCLPIFLNEEFIGFFSVDDCQFERVFSDDEMRMFASVGLMLSSVFNRAKQADLLQSALVKATAASKAKSDFLSSMSHEIRTPMSAIIGMTKIALKKESPKEKNNALNKINDAASHLMGVINDILDMAKIEANKMELTPTEYNFEKMLQRVLTLTRFHSDEKHQNLTLSIAKKIPVFVVGDEQRLAQAITNVLSNAIKFTREGGDIALEAAITKESNIILELSISVTDTGIGIPEDKLDKLFNPFVQAEKDHQHAYGGTGLGLHITKRIVEMMGGKITAESKLGVGTTFTLTVQIGRGVQTEVSEESKTEWNLNKLRGKNLLIAEDVEVNREIMLTLLEDSGLIIECATTGKEALDMFTKDSEKYDIIFMDMQMPEMCGIEATTNIRAVPRRKKLPIIALTANVFKDDIEKCLAAGMDDHLGKPFDIDKIFEKLHMHLE
ncbi:MAG: ATP-binding protein [Defluviitaleaceae bacterium]|nr:ATP-binding protein [Defluviitaleaceae bacterium]